MGDCKTLLYSHKNQRAELPSHEPFQGVEPRIERGPKMRFLLATVLLVAAVVLAREPKINTITLDKCIGTSAPVDADTRPLELREQDAAAEAAAAEAAAATTPATPAKKEDETAAAEATEAVVVEVAATTAATPAKKEDETAAAEVTEAVVVEVAATTAATPAKKEDETAAAETDRRLKADEDSWL